MLPKRIRQLRERAGESCTVFGERFPVDRKTIERWESGAQKPSPMAVDRLRKLSDELDPVESPEPESVSTQAVPRRRGVMPSQD